MARKRTEKNGRITLVNELGQLQGSVPTAGASAPTARKQPPVAPATESRAVVATSVEAAAIRFVKSQEAARDALVRAALSGATSAELDTMISRQRGAAAVERKRENARQVVAADVTTPPAHGEPRPELDVGTLKAQIGMTTIWAISGGRTTQVSSDTVRLPVSNGYSVEISYTWDDTYTVRRVLKRGDRTFIKGEATGVYADQIGETAYQASCFRNGPWGEAPEGD